MDIESQASRPTIFEYDNFRNWLGDLYEYYKSTTSYFSYRYFSKRAGFSSPNYLKLVINGERNISEESLRKFVHALKMPKSEAEYFRILVRFGQAKGTEEKSLHATELVRSRAHQKIHPLMAAELRYYAQWFYIPIRELVGTSGFKEDHQWISSQFRFSVSMEEVANALKDLEKIGLIHRDDSGQLQQSHQNLATSSEVSSTLVAKYHHDMIRRASHSIDMIPKDEREISGTCIALSEKNVDKIKTLVREFRKNILALTSEESEADLIYQLNFQLFPLAGHFSEDLPGGGKK